MSLDKRTTRSVVIRALLGDLLIAVTKYVAAIFSGSAAILAEAIHSSSDTVNQFLLLLGYNLSTKKDASKFPFGRGREQFSGHSWWRSLYSAYRVYSLLLKVL